MSERSRTNLIKKIYQDVADPGGFASPFRLWQRVKKIDGGITLAQVRSVLRGLDAYTLHRRVRRVPRTRRYLSSGCNHYFQIDLFVLSDALARVNRQKYILFAIDTFSRKLFARPLKTKGGAEVARALESIIRENKRPFLKVVSDKGKEWLNAHVSQLFAKYKIVHFTTENVYHAGMIERAIRTMRERFGKYMTHFKTSVFMPKLSDFVSAYNKTPHSALPPRMAPLDVNRGNELKVWKHQFAKHFRRAPGYRKDGPGRLKVGEIVRITRFQGIFKKSSDTTFTSERFVVTHVLATKPTTYKIAALQGGEPIQGIFYRAELQPVAG